MPADSPLAAEKDGYRKTATELTDLIRDLDVFVGKFQNLAQSSDSGQANIDQVHCDAQLAYQELATLLQLAARLAHP